MIFSTVTEELGILKKPVLYLIGNRFFDSMYINKIAVSFKVPAVAV